ncbi:MAG TPA: carbohydrate ABC transporter permease [Chloroflexia bacterium]|nr:carbohydrate ABC transporter permease [Chloroflexia bacterium]
MSTHPATRAAAAPMVVQRVRRTPLELVASMARKSLVHIALFLIALIWLVPTVGLLITSLRPRPDIASSGWWTVLSVPRFTLGNYQEVLNTQGMWAGFANSLFISVPSTVLPVLIAALAAFAFAWIPFPGRDAIFLLVVALLVVPIQMTFVPVLNLLNPLHLTQSYVGIWLAHTAFGLPFAVFLLRNFFILLPADLIEAARIDGASNLRIFFSIILPLSVPAIASLTIFQFLGVWNDLLMALVFIQSPTARPLTTRISDLLSTYGTEWHLLSAGSFVLMIVPLIVFFSLQRYFVQGLLAGAVK